MPKLRPTTDTMWIYAFLTSINVYLVCDFVVPNRIWTTSSVITGTTADSTQNCMQILHTYHFQLSRYHGRMQAIEDYHNVCHLGSKISKMSPLQSRSRLCGIKHCFLADATETLYPRFDARLAAGQIEGDIHTSRRNRHQLQSAMYHPIESLQASPLSFPVPA